MNTDKLFRFTTEYKDNKYSVISYEDVVNYTINRKDYSFFLTNLEEVTFEPAKNEPLLGGLITIKGVSDGSLLLKFNNGVHQLIFEKPDEEAVREFYEYIEPFTRVENDYDYTIRKTFNKNKTGIRRVGLSLIKENIEGKTKFNNNFIVLELSGGDLIVSRNLISYNGNHIDLNQVVSDNYDQDNMTYTINEKNKDLTIEFEESDLELIEQLVEYMQFFIKNNSI